MTVPLSYLLPQQFRWFLMFHTGISCEVFNTFCRWFQEERRKCAWNSQNFFILDQTIINFSRQSMPILGMVHLKNECSEHNPCITKLNPQSYRCNIAATLGNMFLETIFCLDAGEDERGSPVLSEIPSIYLVSSFTLSANDGLVLE